MAKYIALADGVKPVRVKNDAGEYVTRYQPYSKGDEVEFTEEEAQRLLDTGGLAEPNDDEDVTPTQVEDGLISTATPQVPHSDPAGTLPAAVSGQTADEGLRGDADAEGDSVAPDEQDAFEDMKYPQLQAAARDRGLSPAGSTDDLKARLRAFTAGTSAEDADDVTA